MNKKILVLIITIVVIAIGAGIGYYFNQNQKNGTTLKGNQDNEALNNNKSENKTLTTENETLANDTENTKKVLVLYYSLSGNTETLANFIHNHVGGDIVKIETEKTYPENYNDLIDEAQDEQNENARPEMKDLNINIDDYDTIFLGYPNWWGDMPMVLYTFLDEYDLSGKTIAPFITHGGSGLSGTPAKIQNEEPNATVTKGLAISGSSASSSESLVVSWLNEIGF